MVINPGAAGARRFKLQPSVAKLFIDGRKSDAQLIQLLDDEVEPVVELI
jgi:uncharacterized protein